jgi:3-hydroxyacyl-[acyl-carrier-protein] dehydratase
MILKDSFYQILEKTQSENGFQFLVEIDAKHNIFEGHFPNNPVTPGVVQMEMVKELLKVAMEKNVRLLNMPSCKFLAILNPEINPKIKVDLDIKDETLEGFRVNVVFSDESTSFLKMTGIYGF